MQTAWLMTDEEIAERDRARSQESARDIVDYELSLKPKETSTDDDGEDISQVLASPSELMAVNEPLTPSVVFG